MGRYSSLDAALAAHKDVDTMEFSLRALYQEYSSAKMPDSEKMWSTIYTISVVSSLLMDAVEDDLRPKEPRGSAFMKRVHSVMNYFKD